MTNEKLIEQILDKFEQIQIEKSNYGCPYCHELQEYFPNPMYMHQCKHCNKKMTYSDLIYLSDRDKMRNFLIKVI